MMYILNPRNGAVSTHSATPTHLVEHNGVLYGAAGESLVGFAAAAAPPIDLHLGEIELAGGDLVGLPWIEIEIGATKPLILNLTAVRDAAVRRSVAYVVRPADAAPQWCRVDLGRMPQGRRWSLRLTNTGGDNVAITGLRMHPVLARR